MVCCDHMIPFSLDPLTSLFRDLKIRVDDGGGSNDEILVEEHICQTHLCSPEVLYLSVCYFPLFKLGPSLDIVTLSEVR